MKQVVMEPTLVRGDVELYGKSELSGEGEVHAEWELHGVVEVQDSEG